MVPKTPKEANPTTEELEQAIKAVSKLLGGNLWRFTTKLCAAERARDAYKPQI